MKKLKVVVYAISKNESKFVNRWYESMKEADEIYVLDTGSTDDTVARLKENNIHVAIKEIVPWRFDVARNESLKLVPEDVDVCVCTDLDEVFEPGWRKKIEDSWNNGNRLYYKYNWSLDENNVPLVSFICQKIHDRKHYSWKYPVHEVLACDLKDEIVHTNTNIVLNHYPDSSKSRGQYLELLELSVKENPLDDRNYHYLGREYMFHKDYNKSIETLLHHINMDNSTWKEERCASMRFIARDYKYTNRYDEAKIWLDKAINECPNSREPYVELAILQLEMKDYYGVINNCLKALTIKEKELIYINETFCWDSTIDDLLSISYYNLGLKELAVYHITQALNKSPTNRRLLMNKEIIENMT